jgi:hypothetical protein
MPLLSRDATTNCPEKGSTKHETPNKLAKQKTRKIIQYSFSIRYPVIIHIVASLTILE